MTNAVTKYWQTLQHLKPVQVYGRLWFRLARPRPDLKHPPRMRACNARWVSPARRTPSLVGPTRLRLLNDERDLDRTGWDDPAIPKLWRYNLHYFDDLAASESAARLPWHEALVARWIAENPPAGGTGWEPYPTALRMVNWIKWALSGHALDAATMASLAVQARWLRGRLEWHLLGNHLLANAKALIFAGVFFEGQEAETWLTQGLAIYETQLREQVLADGGHFELSPMYHAIILEDVLDVINLDGAYPGTIPADLIATWRELTQRMRVWLATMTHPDGGISFFNDAAFGIAPVTADLDDYAGRLGLAAIARPADGVTHLAQSGYVRVQSSDMVALIDVARIGPDYLPGHAHADTLSFELSLLGQRIFVNSGTSVYAEGTERLRQRSTAAHNTVVVAGADSSEVWGAFRVARRARPFDVGVAADATVIRVGAAHDGYRRLSGRAAHRRTFTIRPKTIVIEDVIQGRFSQAQFRLHLHPATGARNDGQVAHIGFGGSMASCTIAGGTLRLLTATWHPEFGVTHPNQLLVCDFDGPSCTATISW